MEVISVVMFVSDTYLQTMYSDPNSHSIKDDQPGRDHCSSVGMLVRIQKHDGVTPELCGCAQKGTACCRSLLPHTHTSCTDSADQHMHDPSTTHWPA